MGKVEEEEYVLLEEGAQSVSVQGSRKVYPTPLTPRDL